MGCEIAIITFVKMIKMLSVCMWSMQPFLRCLSFIVQWDWLISIVSSLYNRRRYQGGLIRLQLDSCLVWQRRLLIHLKKGLRFRLQLRLRLSLSVVIACSMRCSWIVSYAHKCPTHEILWLCSCRIGMGSFWALFKCVLIVISSPKGVCVLRLSMCTLAYVLRPAMAIGAAVRLGVICLPFGYSSLSALHLVII
jgi:hypothetical protein